MASIAKALTDWLSPIRSGLAAVREAERAKRRAHAEAVAERVALGTRPPPLGDLLAALPLALAQLARESSRPSFGADVAHAIGGRPDLRRGPDGPEWRGVSQEVSLSTVLGQGPS